MTRYAIEGEVQGVNFRAMVAQKAHELGVAGFVRNEKDGSVTLVAQGERKEDLLAWIKKGPGFSRVEEMRKVGEEDEHYEEFSIVR